MQASNANAIDNPITLLEHTTAEAIKMREKLSKAILLQKAEATDLAWSDPVWTTYPAVSTCNNMPEFLQLVREYFLRGFNLQLVTGLRIRTPSPIIGHLPMNNDLVIPTQAIQHVTTAVMLQRASIHN